MQFPRIKKNRDLKIANINQKYAYSVLLQFFLSHVMLNNNMIYDFIDSEDLIACKFATDSIHAIHGNIINSTYTQFIWSATMQAIPILDISRAIIQTFSKYNIT